MTAPSGATPRPYQRNDQHERLGEPPWKPDDPALIAWEAAHGHDVQLDCYVEYGCYLIQVDLDAAEQRLAEAERLLAVVMDLDAVPSNDFWKECEAFLAQREAQP